MTHEARQQRDANDWCEPSRHGVPEGYLTAIYDYAAAHKTLTDAGQDRSGHTPAGRGSTPGGKAISPAPFATVRTKAGGETFHPNPPP